MKTLIRIMTKTISPDHVDASIASLVSYAAALGILVLGVLKLAALGLEEAQLFFGLLLVLAIMMQFIIAGLVLDVCRRIGGLGEKA